MERKELLLLFINIWGQKWNRKFSKRLTMPSPKTFRHDSRRELCDQFINMDNDIIYMRPHSSLRLKHPCHKLMKSFWVWRLRSSWPFDLSI